MLSQALLEEFSDYISQSGLTAAMTVKQGRQESPQQYYHRLSLAYFGSRNEPGMEEDLHFKSLFVQNLHPTTSHHLGVAACPRTLTSRNLRELALKGFAKQKQTTMKHAEPNTILSLETKTLELEGAFDGRPLGRHTPPPKAHQPTQAQEQPFHKPSNQGSDYSQPSWHGQGQRNSRHKVSHHASTFRSGKVRLHQTDGKTARPTAKSTGRTTHLHLN